MSEPADLRASDAERELAATEIREHYAAGRLTDDELDDRLAAVYAARTAGALRALRVDLPRLPVDRRAAVDSRRAGLRRELMQQTGGGIGLFVLCVAIWAASGAHGSFWPGWVALVTVLPLVRGSWRLYGPAPELDRVEADLARRRERDARRHGRHARRH